MFTVNDASATEISVTVADSVSNICVTHKNVQFVMKIQPDGASVDIYKTTLPDDNECVASLWVTPDDLDLDD